MYGIIIHERGNGKRVYMISIPVRVDRSGSIGRAKLAFSDISPTSFRQCHDASMAFVTKRIVVAA